MGFPKQEHWSALPFPSPEDLPNPEIEPDLLQKKKKKNAGTNNCDQAKEITSAKIKNQS